MRSDNERNVLIVEKQDVTRSHLENVIADMGANIFSAANAREAYTIALEYNIDVFLIDIILDSHNSKDTSGIKFALQMREIRKYARAIMIFITFVEDPAMEAYTKLHCFRYLKKPLTAEMIRSTMREALELPRITLQERDYIALPSSGIYVVKKLRDIIYAEKNGKVMTVYTVGDSVSMNYVTIPWLLERLGLERFVQCSKNALLNMDYIGWVNVGKGMVEFRDGLGNAKIGPKFKKQFLKTFEIYKACKKTENTL